VFTAPVGCLNIRTLLAISGSILSASKVRPQWKAKCVPRLL
jgi:hypothetical protein